MKLLTLEDYEKAGESFWPKYWYVSKELGENARAEDILKVLESIGTNSGVTNTRLHHFFGQSKHIQVFTKYLSYSTHGF